MFEAVIWITNILISVVLWQKCGAQDPESYPRFHLVARLTVPKLSVDAWNSPNYKVSEPRDKFLMLQDYTKYMDSKLRETHSQQERNYILYQAEQKLFLFTDRHMQDLWALLVQLDRSLVSMVQFKTSKRMAQSEQKIKYTNAHIPFGVYASPEYKCLGSSYWISSSHSSEDTEMIFNSEKKPHCLMFRGSFMFGGYYHRPTEKTYIGPTGQKYSVLDPVQGLYCEFGGESEADCVYKVVPLEEFPESVEYEPKVSYFCGPYRYFLPPTTDIRCVFSMFSMSFTMKWGLDGGKYKHSELAFSYNNGQVFYTDEPWSGLSCWSYACKWKHNQGLREKDLFVY